MLHETWTSYECDGREMDHTQQQQQQMLSKNLSQSKGSSCYPWMKGKVDQEK